MPIRTAQQNTPGAKPRLPRFERSTNKRFWQHLKDSEVRHAIAARLGDLPPWEAVTKFREMQLRRPLTTPPHLSTEDEAILNALSFTDLLRCKDPKFRADKLERERESRRERAERYKHTVLAIWAHALCRWLGKPFIRPPVHNPRGFSLPEIPWNHPRLRKLNARGKRGLYQVWAAHAIVYEFRRYAFGAGAGYFASARFLSRELLKKMSPTTVWRYTKLLLELGVIEPMVDPDTGEVVTLYDLTLLVPGKPVQRTAPAKQPEPAAAQSAPRREPVSAEISIKTYLRQVGQVREQPKKRGGIQLQKARPAAKNPKNIRRVVRDDGTVEWWEGDRLLR
jgi:hypothetical protein